MAEALEGERPTEEVNVQLPHVGDLQIKGRWCYDSTQFVIKHCKAKYYILTIKQYYY